MNSPFSFDAMLVFSFLSFMLILGIFLRARSRLLQKFLFPGCLAGGALGLLLRHTGLIDIAPSDLESVAYHFFNISFISVGLTRDSADAGPSPLRGAGWMTLVQGLTFPMQAVIGGCIVLLLNLWGMDLFPTFGFLTPLGFNEGPGQALSIGKAWEALGFAHGAAIGVTLAAAGYFFAFFAGVPLVNYGIRKGWAANSTGSLSRALVTGLADRDAAGTPAGTLTLHSGNAETLAFQAALVGAVYGITWAGLNTIGSLLPPDVAAILWGFFFFFGLAVAFGVRWLMEKTGVAHLADPGIQRRITGWAIDYLIVATAAAIQFAVILEYLVPISLMALFGGLFTTLLICVLGRRLDRFGLERAAAIFGTVTGTVSCGLLLLRIADPEFKSPVAVEIALMNLFSLPLVGGCSVLVNAPLWWGWSLGATTLAFAGIFVLVFLLMHRLGYLSKKGTSESGPA